MNDIKSKSKSKKYKCRESAKTIARVSPIGVTANDYDNETDNVVTYLCCNCPDYMSFKAYMMFNCKSGGSRATIQNALMHIGISDSIIRSKNSDDKILVADLVATVKQKLEMIQVSPDGVSADDYATETDNAVSYIVHNCPGCNKSRVSRVTIKCALVHIGISASIIRSKNSDDKILVADLVATVKQKLEMIQVSPDGVSADDYATETDNAVSYIVHNCPGCNKSRVSRVTIKCALVHIGISASIILSRNSDDKILVADLVATVKQKLKMIQVSPDGVSADDYATETDNAVSYICDNCPGCNKSRVSRVTIQNALMHIGISASIILSRNSDDKILVADLVAAVKQKLKMIQVSPDGVSADDYATETDNAVSYIVHNCPRYNTNPAQIPKHIIDQALLESGISVDIILSRNSNDKILVADLVATVKRKLFPRIASSTPSLSLSRDKRILEARKYANRMECKGASGKGEFQAPVCIICDCHIIGTGEILYLRKDQLESNRLRIGVDSYNKFYAEEHNYPELPEELIDQYKVEGLEGLLLSKRSKRCTDTDRFETCRPCYDSITKGFNSTLPPKFSIANGFVIGHIPQVLKLSNGDDTTREVVVEYIKDGVKMNKATGIVRALVAPTRAYGYTFSYFGGAQQSIRGHYVFYEVDQSLVGAVMNNIQVIGANPHVHIVLGGRFTPSQKAIIRKKTVVDTKFVTDLLTWFIQNGHRGFSGFTPPRESECPAPKIDEEVECDFEIDKETEEKFDGGIYHFSSVNSPSQDTGAFGTQVRFTKSLLERTPPTLLAYGGDYTSGHSLQLENVLPTAFPWGLGGPTMPRRIGVGLETCLKHYGKHSLKQFMRGDFCLVATHILDRQLSYTSGKVKCRANIDGVSLAERVSRLTVKDLEDVVSGASTNCVADQLLTSVSASCKAMGHTSEAAAHWRRIYFALSDRHGLNAFMLTITPNDLASFSVKVIALAGEMHTMPSLDATEEECIADLTMRKETRLDFPGACSLYFESVMQIVLEVLLGWNSKEQKGSEDGIMGELDAWGMAVEEQARKTLHSHWLLWSKRLAKMRDELFSGNKDRQDKARADFCTRIDEVMSASYTADDWIVEHKCGAKGEVGEVFKECNHQVLRDARHKVLCHDICGNVMECKECHEKVSTQDIINLALNEWYQNALKDTKSSVENLTIPLSKGRLDVAMYRTAYDQMSGCHAEDKFWGNEDVRRILQISGDNEHYALHGPRCFKKSSECASGSFPQAYNRETNISVDEEAKKLEWYLLDGSIKNTAPFLVLPKRPLGCQYLNTHNVPISTIFNCNSNVIIGDASNTFYLTCYGSKSTQKEDREKKERILKALIRRLKRLQMERERCLLENREDDRSDFAQGLSMVLSAMNASTSSDVVSSPMAHYLVQNGGSRFKASHGPKHLLIYQMEDTLDNKAVNFTLRRTNKSKANGTVVRWPDSSSHDYLHRPGDDEVDGNNFFEDMCAYEYTELYEKKFFSFKDMDADKQDTIATGREDSKRYRFIDSHPGREFAYIEKMKLPAVAVVSLSEGKLCLVRDLELDTDMPSDDVKDKREDYAKMALMMFYPFRSLDDLKTSGSYWAKFDSERARHSRGQKTDKFWQTGFEILQNIEDRMMMLQSDHKVRARDPVQKKTIVKVDDVKPKQNEDKIGTPDITQFRDDDESSYAESDIEREFEDGKRWSHNELIKKAYNITDDRIIAARFTEESILSSSGFNQMQEEGNDTRVSSSPVRDRSYPTLLEFISGALVGVTDYDDVYYPDLMDEDLSMDESTNEDDIHVITQDNSSEDTVRCNLPTLVGIARKVAQQDKMKLDEKQYIAYEIIACTFLLQLVEEGRDQNSILGQHLGSALGSSNEDMDQLVEHLKARGGMEQLLMFLTGPAGAGKSTAVKVAERFCLEFCTAVSVMWHDETFLFTACSGSAAAIFGGITIHSAAVLNGKVTDKARNAWRGKVKILIVDEISYFSDNDIKKLDRHLKDLNGVPNKPFGGQSIIFSGDFRQFEAILAKHLLYHRNSSQLWENSINCVIILENIHRFKNDPEYGEMLTRLWRDDLTQEDREKINTRVVGRNGVTLPSTFDGDVVYACSTNKERNAVQAGIFRDHILNTHPVVNSPEVPPAHSIIIEAVIQSSKSKTSHVSIGKFTRDRIIHTCGDADCVVNNTKYVDPALRLYVGAHCMCTVDNKRLKDKVPIGNGTLCRVVRIKLNEHAPSHRWQNWDGRKVSTVSAKHVDWVEFEYHPKSKSVLKLEGEIRELEWELRVNQESYEIDDRVRRKRAKTATSTSRRMMPSDPILQNIISELNGKKLQLKKEQQSRRFKLEPQTSTTTVSFKCHDLAPNKEEYKCRVTQIQVILADSITGHKLQGMTLPYVIIASWGYFAKNWPYVVLSRCTTFKGLYLFKPIDMDKSFAPSKDLVEYLRRAERLQDHILHTRKARMAAYSNRNAL